MHFDMAVKWGPDLEPDQMITGNPGAQVNLRVHHPIP